MLGWNIYIVFPTILIFRVSSHCFCCDNSANAFAHFRVEMISGPPETNLPVALPFPDRSLFHTRFPILACVLDRAMDNSSGSLNFQQMGTWPAGPQGSQLPHNMPPSFNHHNLNHHVVGSGNPMCSRPAWGQMPRTQKSSSSESPLIEELPSWFEELLNEPETPVQRGHRRSTSDSFAYFNTEAKATNRNEDHKLINRWSAWPSSGSLSTSFDKYQNRARVSASSSLNCLNNKSDLPLTTKDQPNRINAPDQPDGVPSKPTKMQDSAESSSHPQEASSERSDCSSAQPSLSKSDAKRAKQQFAQRSRIRKIQYIAELEMSVQALQAEGCEISAAVEYLDQHNLILGMKNRALQQRLENLSHEYLIKQLEQDMLEREIRRLQTLYQQHQQQQQQQQQQQLSGHRRPTSRNSDSSFSNTTSVKI